MLMLPVTKYVDVNAGCNNGLLLGNGAFWRQLLTETSIITLSLFVR